MKECEMYRDTHYNRDADDPVPVGALFDLNDDALGESSDGRGVNCGFSVHYVDPTPRRSLRNLDIEKRSRASLRELARHDPSAFRAALPADILDRLLLPDGDDVPSGNSVRHPTLAPTWPRPGLPDWLVDMRLSVDLDDLPDPVPVEAPGDGRFMVAPRARHNVSLGLAIGAASIAAEGDIPSVDIHGVKIGLRRADRATPRRPRAGAPLPKPHWPGRKLCPQEVMAFCAARKSVPSFLAGISIGPAFSPVKNHLRRSRQ